MFYLHPCSQTINIPRNNLQIPFLAITCFGIRRKVFFLGLLGLIFVWGLFSTLLEEGCTSSHILFYIYQVYLRSSANTVQLYRNYILLGVKKNRVTINIFIASFDL